MTRDKSLNSKEDLFPRDLLIARFKAIIESAVPEGKKQWGAHAQFAKITGISQTTLRKWVGEGGFAFPGFEHLYTLHTRLGLDMNALFSPPGQGEKEKPKEVKESVPQYCGNCDKLKDKVISLLEEINMLRATTTTTLEQRIDDIAGKCADRVATRLRLSREGHLSPST